MLYPLELNAVQLLIQGILNRRREVGSTSHAENIEQQAVVSSNSYEGSKTMEDDPATAHSIDPPSRC